MYLLSVNSPSTTGWMFAQNPEAGLQQVELLEGFVPITSLWASLYCREEERKAINISVVAGLGLLFLFQQGAYPAKRLPGCYLPVDRCSQRSTSVTEAPERRTPCTKSIMANKALGSPQSLKTRQC